MTLTALPVPATSGDDIGHRVHPAADLFPLMRPTSAKYAALVADIKTNGLQRPIVRTPFGAILDGRTRYRACHEAGVKPRFAAYSADPWLFAITAHGWKLSTNNARSMVAARMAEQPPALKPPTARQIQRAFEISIGSMGRAKRVVRTGTPGLRAITAAGDVPLTTAARVAGLSTEQQDKFVERIRAGGVPRQIARPGWRGDDSPPAPDASISKREARYRFVQEPALRLLGNSLDGLAMVLASADGLDPAITPEQAAQWRADLSRRAKSLRQLMALLKERKELS